MIQKRLPCHNVGSKDPVDELPIHKLILYRQTIWHKDGNDRLAATSTRTAHPMQAYVGPTGSSNVLAEFLENYLRPGRIFACGRTYLNPDPIGGPFASQCFLRFHLKGLESLSDHRFHTSPPNSNLGLENSGLQKFPK
jgi:hypothetical protein